MICRTWSVAVPMELAFKFFDRSVVDAGVAIQHQAILGELPVFVAIRAKPASGIVVVFIGKAHRDAIVSECPEFFDQTIVEFPLPLTDQKFDDLVTALEDFGAIAPFAVESIGERHLVRIARVPRVLRSADLSDGCLTREWRHWRAGLGHCKFSLSEARRRRGSRG